MLTHLWHLGTMLAPFWLRLGHLGSILPLSWAILAPIWPRWAPSWLRVGHLGSVLALSWAILAPTWPSWLDLASPWWLYLGSNLAILAILALPWAMLSSFGVHVGVLAHLMAMLALPELQVVQLGSIWMRSWATLNSFSTHVGASLAIL